MVIKITQSKDKWRVHIDGEVWELNNREDLEKMLRSLIDNKINYGTGVEDRNKW